MTTRFRILELNLAFVEENGDESLQMGVRPDLHDWLAANIQGGCHLYRTMQDRVAKSIYIDDDHEALLFRLAWL